MSQGIQEFNIFYKGWTKCWTKVHIFKAHDLIDVDFPLKGKAELEANKSDICCLKIYFIEASSHSYTEADMNSPQSMPSGARQFLL